MGEQTLVEVKKQAANWVQRQSRWGRRGRRHVELGQTQVDANVGEGGEWSLASDELRHKLEALVEDTQDVQH
jgi:hypothetical protein